MRGCCFNMSLKLGHRIDSTDETSEIWAQEVCAMLHDHFSKCLRFMCIFYPIDVFVVVLTFHQKGFGSLYAHQLSVQACRTSTTIWTRFMALANKKKFLQQRVVPGVVVNRVSLHRSTWLRRLPRVPRPLFSHGGLRSLLRCRLSDPVKVSILCFDTGPFVRRIILSVCKSAPLSP